MKLLITVKRVVDYEAKLIIDKSGTTLDTTDTNMIVNPFDEIAVEEALRIRESLSEDPVDIVIVSVGAVASYKALKENSYMVDVSTNTLYDLTKCSVSNLNQSNLVYLSDLNDTNKYTYREAEC